MQRPRTVLTYFLTQRCDEVSVEMNGLVQRQQHAVPGPHLLYPGAALVRHEHVADHRGERAEPTAASLV